MTVTARMRYRLFTKQPDPQTRKKKKVAIDRQTHHPLTPQIQKIMGCAQSRRSNCLGGGSGVAGSSGGGGGGSDVVLRERSFGASGQGEKLPSFDTAVTAGPSELHKHHDVSSSGGPSALLSAGGYGHGREPSREEVEAGGADDVAEGARYEGGGDAGAERAATSVSLSSVALGRRLSFRFLKCWVFVLFSDFSLCVLFSTRLQESLVHCPTAAKSGGSMSLLLLSRDRGMGDRRRKGVTDKRGRTNACPECRVQRQHRQQ